MIETLNTTRTTWADIQNAAERLNGVAYHTPVLRSRHFDERAGCYGFFKAENLQRSGSIRFRGVFNCIKAEVEKHHVKTIVAHSSGNHTQAVALAAKLLGLRAILVLPEGASYPKIAAAQQYGAEIEFYDRKKADPAEIARSLAVVPDTFLVTPGRTPHSCAGDATAIVELLEEIHDLDALVLPFASHELLAACAVAAKQMIPHIKIYGAHTHLSDAARFGGHGIEEILSVQDSDNEASQIFTLERMKLLVEPAGATGAAAVYRHKEEFEGRKTGIVLSSGNVDFHKLSMTLSRHSYPKREVVRKDQSEQYPVTCFNCGQTYDALESVFCNCVSAERSLVCPRCLTCFCKAPPKYKDRFWQNAPQPMWDREAEEHNRELYVRPNVEPYEVKRPLVLVVDDDRRTLHMAAKVIEGLGYGTIIAADGETGLQLARKYLPEMIITDALMPRMDGREMCRRLKEDPATAKVKIVITTALYTQSKYRTEAFRQFHVDEYLSKPLGFNELRLLLQKFLG